MRRFNTKAALGLLATAAAFFCAPFARAQVHPEGAAKSDESTNPEGRSGKGGSKDADEMGPRLKAVVATTLNLKKMVEEKLDLSSEQKAAITKLVNDFVADAKHNVPLDRKGPPAPRDNLVMEPNLPQLEKMLKAAQERGDEAKIKEVERKIDVAKREFAPSYRDPTPLIEKMREKLRDNQKADFDIVVERWKAISPRGPRTGPFQQLRRAVNDPDLGMTAEQKKDTDAIFEVSIMAIRGNPERTPEKTVEVIEQTKKDVLAKLTAEQRIKAEANLKSFQADEGEFEETRLTAKHRETTEEFKKRQRAKKGKDDK